MNSTFKYIKIFGVEELMHIKQVLISGFLSFRSQNEVENFREMDKFNIICKEQVPTRNLTDDRLNIQNNSKYLRFGVEVQMHIKQVLISGFRSFRSQNEIENFSPKHNVIVGRNGSGKSNFFDAIQFVLLGPKFASLRQEDRQHLLHEGAGTSVMAAYVEIVFDNSDGRLSVESEEVILRRTVGVKKDEFFLNRKRIQKSEVVSLLESAGFSKSNPYYIVQQGKVSNLCVMKDKDRLNLLKEVAGTTVYEERRTESIKIIEESVKKQEKVEEVLSFIEERLKELEMEKIELTEYESLDKQRRAIEYSLYDKEFRKANDQLVQIDIIRDEEGDRQQNLYAQLSTLQDEMVLKDDSLAASTIAYKRMLSKREEKSKEISEVITRRSTIEVELQEIEAAARASHNEAAQLTEQLEHVNHQIAQCNNQLAAIEPSHVDKSKQLHDMQSSIVQVSSRIESLYGKQGRGAQFSSKAERDKFLQTQINTLSAQITDKTKLLQKTVQEVATEENRLQIERNQISIAEQQQKGRVDRYDEINRIIRERTQYRNELQDQRKSSWRDVETLQEQIQEARQELERGKQQLNRSLPRHIASGLQAVESIVKQQNIEGYYGPLIDNITLKSDAFRNAVEVAAGNSLFHVIVEDDKLAAFLIKELDRLKAGRLTFLPLNRLQNQVINYPDSNDVRPLISVAIQYDVHVDLAVKQVFGHKLLARDLDIAARFSKEFNLDAITKDGDQVNRKGGFEGGYHDERTSRINAVFKIRESNETLGVLLQKEEQLKKQSDQAEEKVNEVLRELQQLETEKNHLRQNGDQFNREISNRSKQLNVALDALESLRKGITALESQIAVVTDQRQAFMTEQSSPLVEKLTNKERSELRSLEEQQRSLQTQIESLETEVMAVTNTKDKLKADLDSNLLKRKEELEQMMSQVKEVLKGGHDYETELSSLQLNKDHSKIVQVRLEKELSEMNAVIQKKSSEVSALEKSLDGFRAQEQKLNDQLSEATKMLDKLLNKRSMLLETVQSRQRMMRDLGNIPRKEMEELKNLSSDKQLMSKLKGINEQLKKYSSVNRKALDQFVSFNEQRETLIQRKAEMDRDSVAIQQLIDSLDAQKDEAILRTFRGVSQHFAEVFAELVPGGKGQLMMKTSLDSSLEADADPNTESMQDYPLDDDEDKDDYGAVNTFKGVQVRVSFSGAGQQYQMNQLSGGQKALVALALIFAIQRCDPAPFYLFDEIDQALDANYRAGVARLIQKQVTSDTAPAQFITTTFRPELVASADKCYGIALHNKVSNIFPLEQVNAQNFVTNLLIEEETVGKVTAVPDFSTASRNRNQNRKPVGSPDQDDDDEDEVEETLKSPNKIRKVVRNNKSKGLTALNKNIKTKSRITLHRNSKSAPVDDDDDDGDKFDNLMEDEEEEEEDREGLIELDGEDEAAFANLGLNDICEEEDD